MQTEVDSNKVSTEQVGQQMDLLERRITGVVAAISRLRSENAELLEERDSLARSLREHEEKLAGASPERMEAELGALREEIELLHLERESIARRIAELLDKLDLVST